MGLKEYLKAGAVLKRDIIEIATDPQGSGSVNLGSAYVLFDIETDTACRLRLYDNTSSLNDPTEQARTFGDTNIPAPIALIGDFTMSAGKYTIDPTLYGVTSTPGDKLTYYKIDTAASPPNLIFKRYLLEDSSVSTAARKLLPFVQENLAPGQIRSGSIVSTTIPKTYLFVSASLINTTVPVRVRLYNVASAIFDVVEKNRPYATEAQTQSLMVDAIFNPGEVTHFVPKIVGANIQNMGINLTLIKNKFSTLAGKSEMYYFIENVSAATGSQAVTASFHVFSLED